MSRPPFETPWEYLRFVLKPHRTLVVVAVVVVVIASALEQSVSYLFKLIIDAAEAGEVTKAFWYGMGFPAALLMTQGLFRISGYLGGHLTTALRRDGYQYFFSHILGHSHHYFSNRFAGSIHSKMRNIVDGLDTLIPEILWTYINTLVSLIVTFIFIYFVDTTSAFIFMAAIVTLIIVNSVMAPEKQRRSYAYAEAGSRLSAGLIDTIGNISAVRQYSRLPLERDRAFTLINDHYAKALHSWMRTEVMLLVNSLFLFVFSAALFYTLLTRWQAGLITTGDFVLVAALIAQLAGTLIFIGRAFNSTARTLGEMREGLAELLVPYDIVDQPDARDLLVTKGEIDWQLVNFKYDTAPVFTDFQLKIAPGERLGLVGTSGAGKSTFVSLLLRQHELASGTIAIDGQSIATVTQNSLREAIAVVPQEPALFHRTIKENIIYGKPDATHEEVIEAAKKAQAHDFIMSLPAGYDTMVGERGVKLSGGQKQRVAIARAILKDAPILILDEATSALDSESEVAIQAALHELMVGKTVIAIAHRLSTLREMNRIIVLEQGQIIEEGTHTNLLAQKGVYASLWEHQAGGFLQD